MQNPFKRRSSFHREMQQATAELRRANVELRAIRSAIEATSRSGRKSSTTVYGDALTSERRRVIEDATPTLTRRLCDPEPRA